MAAGERKRAVPPATRAARRAVGLGLAALAAAVVIPVMVGIVGTLFELPTDPLEVGGEVESKELVVCLDQLEAIEADFRQVLSRSFLSTSAPAPEWTQVIQPLERRLGETIERCRLEEADPRPLARLLAAAAAALEEGFSAAGLLWERYRADGWIRGRETRAALASARARVGARTSTASAR